MLIFTLAISCLTTSNLPWLMDLTFQVPMQYCPLQHQTLLQSPVTSTTGCCFCFGSVSSFLWELFLHSIPVAYWATSNLGTSSFSVFLAFHMVLKVRILKWFDIQCTTVCQNLPPWPVRLGWPYRAWLIVSLSQTRLWFMWSVWLFFLVCFFCVCVIVAFILCALWWMRISGLWKLTDGRDWLWRKLGLVLMGGAMLSKSLIQFYVDGPGCVPSLLFDLRPTKLWWQ